MVILPNYTLYSHERQNQRGGGVCIFIANEYTVLDKRSESCMSFEYIDLIVNSKYGKLLFISVIYRPDVPPNAKVSDFLLELENYFCCCSTKAKSPWIICGDFNINLLNFDSDNN